MTFTTNTNSSGPRIYPDIIHGYFFWFTIIFVLDKLKSLVNHDRDYQHISLSSFISKKI